MKIYNSIEELVGHTPLLRLSGYGKAVNAEAEILAKLEYPNPAGSIKDRVALEMILDAEERGIIKKGATLIEPTSGNTGIGIAAIAAKRGYKAIIVMPSNMSRERILLMKAYGAEVVLTDAALGMAGSIAKAEELCDSIEGAYIPGQFDNPSNAMAHYKTTGVEIYEDTGAKIDIFVAGVGTGGTITGTARYLKERKPDIKVVAVEPKDSPLLSGGKAGPHGLAGIGANFIPKILDRSIYDEVATVTTEEAYAAARLIAKTEGILVGISSGAALHAATEEAKKPENKGKTIVVILPDSGSRYLSTDLFE